MMTGTLHKENDLWVVIYKDIVTLFPFTQTANKKIPVLMDSIIDLIEGEVVEFDIVDYSQKCKECGEQVERGRNCSNGCFMKPGNFVFTEKLEYAKIIITKEKSLEFLARQAQELNLGYDTNDGWDNFIFESEKILNYEFPIRYKNWLKNKFQQPIRK